MYFPLSLERGVYSKKLKLFIFSQHSMVGRRQTSALSMGCLNLPTRLQFGSFQPPFAFLCPLEKEQMTNICYPLPHWDSSRPHLNCIAWITVSLCFSRIQTCFRLQPSLPEENRKQMNTAYPPIKECHNSFLHLLPLLLFVPLLFIPQCVFCPKLSSSGKVAGHWNTRGNVCPWDLVTSALQSL